MKEQNPTIEEVHLKVFKFGDWDKSRVEISATKGFKEDYGYLMSACEYLFNIACQRSPSGYEKAMELICKGAMTYKSTKVNDDINR